MSDHEIDIKRIGARRAVVLRDVNLFGVDIPEGFETDGASVPRLFWFIISPYTEALYAAIAHDFQLSVDGKNAKRRKRIDQMFYFNLRDSGINPIRSYAAYFGVRIWSRWYVRK